MVAVKLIEAARTCGLSPEQSIASHEATIYLDMIFSHIFMDTSILPLTLESPEKALESLLLVEERLKVQLFKERENLAGL